MNEDLKNIVAQAIEPKLKEQFINGVNAGWTACAQSLYKQISSLTSAKEIKKVIKTEADKVHIRTMEDSD